MLGTRQRVSRACRGPRRRSPGARPRLRRHPRGRPRPRDLGRAAGRLRRRGAAGRHRRRRARRGASSAYEVVCRVAAASPHGFHARGLHATQVAGTLSAATAVAAACSAWRRAPWSTPSASPARRPAGCWSSSTTGSSTKQLHPGTASLNGRARRAPRRGRRDRPGQRARGAATASRPRCRRKPADPGLGPGRAGRALGGRAHHGQALPVVPADARHARRAGRALSGAARSGPATSSRSAATCTPTAPRSSASRRPTRSTRARPTTRSSRCPGPCAALVLDGVGRGRDVRAGLDRSARGRGAGRPGAHRRGRPPAGWRPTPPATSWSGSPTAGCLRGRVARSAGGPAAPLSDAELDAKFLANAGGDRGPRASWPPPSARSPTCPRSPRSSTSPRASRRPDAPGEPHVTDPARGHRARVVPLVRLPRLHVLPRPSGRAR